MDMIEYDEVLDKMDMYTDEEIEEMLSDEGLNLDGFGYDVE